jgi:hypothetical protein
MTRRGYVVWDKAASIRFRKPGRETLYATFRLDAEHVAGLRAELDREGRAERTYLVELVTATGEVRATCEKLLSIRRPTPAAGSAAEAAARLSR